MNSDFSVDNAICWQANDCYKQLAGYFYSNQFKSLSSNEQFNQLLEVSDKITTLHNAQNQIKCWLVYADTLNANITLNNTSYHQYCRQQFQQHWRLILNAKANDIADVYQIFAFSKKWANQNNSHSYFGDFLKGIISELKQQARRECKNELLQKNVSINMLSFQLNQALKNHFAGPLLDYCNLFDKRIYPPPCDRNSANGQI